MFEMNNISKYKVELMGVSAILIFAGHCANVNILSGGGYIKKNIRNGCCIFSEKKY